MVKGARDGILTFVNSFFVCFQVRIYHIFHQYLSFCVITVHLNVVWEIFGASPSNSHQIQTLFSLSKKDKCRWAVPKNKPIHITQTRESVEYCTWAYLLPALSYNITVIALFASWSMTLHIYQQLSTMGRGLCLFHIHLSSECAVLQSCWNFF